MPTCCFNFLYFSLVNYLGCLICGRINASIFINDKSGGEETDESKQISADLHSLELGQDILIKIKTIKYEQNNNLFIIASFVKSL